MIKIGAALCATILARMTPSLWSQVNPSWPLRQSQTVKTTSVVGARQLVASLRRASRHRERLLIGLDLKSSVVVKIALLTWVLCQFEIFG